MNQPASNNNTIAALTHVGGIFFSFLPSLIVWLVKKDQGGFIVDQAIEALNFQITVIITTIAAIFLSFIIGIYLLPFVMIANLILCIIAAVKSANGEPFRYPVALRLIK